VGEKEFYMICNTVTKDKIQENWGTMLKTLNKIFDEKQRNIDIYLFVFISLDKFYIYDNVYLNCSTVKNKDKQLLYTDT
jgi:hypothetical protein